VAGVLGSGRWKQPGRRTVDSCQALDANYLSARGWLRPGQSNTCSWVYGDRAVSIDLHAEAEQLRLSWRGGDGQERMSRTIAITRVPSGFIGNRAYFVCPGGGTPGAGGSCGRRVFKLYFSHGRFLCRCCSQLVYASRYEQQPWLRASRRANKLRQRLGITGAGVPEKPQGMFVRDYERLLEETLQAEMQATEARTARLLQLAAGIERRHKPPFTL
jgi:hypothetical protein